MCAIARKSLIISFFALLVLLEGIAAAHESSVRLQTGDGVMAAGSAAMTRPAISFSGEEISEEELGCICGKGPGGTPLVGPGHCLSGKIILWDEVKASNTGCIEFNDRGNSMLNAQKNSLIIGGPLRHWQEGR